MSSILSRPQFVNLVVWPHGVVHTEYCCLRMRRLCEISPILIHLANHQQYVWLDIVIKFVYTHVDIYTCYCIDIHCINSLLQVSTMGLTP